MHCVVPLRDAAGVWREKIMTGSDSSYGRPFRSSYLPIWGADLALRCRRSCRNYTVLIRKGCVN